MLYWIQLSIKYKYWVLLSISAVQYQKFRLTVLFGADVDLLGSYAISSPGERQHLNAVIGKFLQTVQLERRQQGGDVSDLTQFWRIEMIPDKAQYIQVTNTCW